MPLNFQSKIAYNNYVLHVWTEINVIMKLYAYSIVIKDITLEIIK
jgi:hypothetical protein